MKIVRSFYVSDLGPVPQSPTEPPSSAQDDSELQQHTQAEISPLHAAHLNFFGDSDQPVTSPHLPAGGLEEIPTISGQLDGPAAESTEGESELQKNTQGEISPLHAAHRNDVGGPDTPVTSPRSTADALNEARLMISQTDLSDRTDLSDSMKTSFHLSLSLWQRVVQNPGGAEKIEADEVKATASDVSLDTKKEGSQLLSGHGTYFDPKLRVLLTGEFEGGALKNGKILSKHNAAGKILWDFKVENGKIMPEEEQKIMGQCMLPNYYASRPRFDDQVKEIKGFFNPNEAEFWETLYGKPKTSGKGKEGVDPSKT